MKKSKTKQNILDDALDLDSDLDLGDLNFDFDPLKDDRKPATKVKDGIISGFTSKLRETAFIRKTLKDVLPRGFGETIDFGDKVTENVRKLYDESAKEIKPAIKDFKRVSAKLIPQDSKLVPKAVLEVLKKWESEKEAQIQNEAQQRESFLALQLGDIFKAQIEQETKTRAEDKAEDRLKLGLDLARHRDTLSVLNESNVHLSRLSQYQTKVTLQYQKKHLELEYRQLFALQDILQQNKSILTLHTESLPKLVKNTGLPDYVKLTSKEFMGEISKRKFIDSVTGSLFGKQMDYVQKMLSGFSDKVKEKVAAGVNDFRMGLFGLETAKEMAGGGGVDKNELGGNVAGSLMAEGVGTLGGKWLRENVVKKSPFLQKTGKKLENFVENAPRKINEFRKDSKYDFETGPKAWLLRTLRDLIPSPAPDTQFNRITFRQLHEPFHLTRRTDKTINEVIPGYLAYILRELQVTRTGDETIDLTKYDFTKNQFISKGQLKKNLLKTILKPEAMQRTKSQLSEILAIVDPQNKLSPEAKQALQARLLENSTLMNEANEKNLGSSYQYKGAGAKEAATHMRTYLSSTNAEQQLKFKRLHNGLAEQVHDPRGVMETLINLGYDRELIESQLLDKTGRFLELNPLMHYYLNSTAENPNTQNKQPVKTDYRPGTRAAMRYSFVEPKGTETKTNAFADRDQYVQELQKIIESSNERLFEQMRLSNEKLQYSNDRLKGIEELVKAGMTVNINRNTNRFNTDFNFDKFNYNKFKEFFKRKKKEENTEEETPNFGKGLSGFLARLMYNTSEVAGGAASGLWKTFKGAAKLNMDILKSMGNQLLNRTVFKIKDVYVEGEDKPRLYAARIRAGIYRRQSDNEIIKSHTEVTGPIIDREGNVVISEEDLDKLYTRDILGGLKKLVIKAARGVGKLGGGIFDFYKKYTPKILAFQFDLLKRTIGTAGKMVKGTWNLLDRPIDIYVPGIEHPVLLAQVMKNGGYFSKLTKKPILRPSDIDGPVIDMDGNEVLSLDMMRKGLIDVKGEKIKLPLQKIFSAAGKVLGGIWSIQKGAWRLTKKIAGGLPRVGKGIFEGFSVEINGKKTATLLEKIYNLLLDRFGKKRVSGDVDGDGVRENSWQDLKRKAKDKLTRKPASSNEKTKKDEKKTDSGLFSGLSGLTDKIGSLISGVSSLFSLGKGATGLIGKGAGVLGKLLTAGRAGLALLPGLGGLVASGGAAAATAASAAGSALGAAATAGAGALGAVGATLGTIGAGILSFVSSPVVLGVAAAAALGYGAYKAYDYFKNKLEPIDKIRLVQYGFHADDTDNFKNILKLENYLKDFTTFGTDGMKIKEKDLDMKKLLSSFDLDAGKKEDLERFFRWYQNRFKPVYLTHCAALLKLKQTIDLTKLSSLKKDELTSYIELVKFPEGPYDKAYLPIVNADYKPSNAEAVKTTIEAVIKELGLKDVKPKTLGNLATVTVAKETGPIQNNKEALTNPNLLQDKYTPEAKKGLVTSITATLDPNHLNKDDRLSALEAIRFRTYGLTDLEVDKVRALRNLEKEVAKDLKNNAGKMEWSGNTVLLLEKVKGYFGITAEYGKEVNDWQVWFNKRFLPVFLDYTTAYLIYANKSQYDDKVNLLKPTQQLDIARLIGGMTKVWSIISSPFPNYGLNTNSETVKPNLQFLEDTVKFEKALEDAKRVSNDKTSPTTKPKEKPYQPPKNAVGTQYDQPGSPDGEAKPTLTATITASNGKTNPNGLRLAGGKLFDGRNGFNFINLAKGVDLSKVNPALMQQFYGMVEEYGQLTGKKVTVTDGFRSYEQQVAMKQKYGNRAAEPGTSLHEFGLALDVDSDALNEMDRLGLMRKYGFMRPVGKEPWHMEPAGIQMNIDKYKRSPNLAIEAIEAGVGRGGGGQGTLTDAPAYSRSRELSEKILMAKVSPNVQIDKKADALELAKNESSSTGFTSPSLPSNGQALKTNTTAMATGNVSNPMMHSSFSVDSEAKPKISGGYMGSVATTSNSQLGGTRSNLPENPNINIPTPKGDVQSMVKTVEAAAKMVGVDPTIAVSTVAIESGFNPNAKAGSSSASGLYQFTNSTWNETVSKYGNKYGINPGTASPFDPRTNAIMGAHYLKDITRTVESKTDRDVGPTETYLAHFLGPAGASSFIKALDRQPDAVAAQVLPNAADSNRAIFFNNGQPRSLAQVYNLLDYKVKNKAESFGIKLPDSDRGPQLPTIENEATTLKSSNRLSAGPSFPNDTSATRVSGGGYMGSVAQTQTRATPNFTEMSRSPMNDTYGFNPKTIQTSTQSAKQNTLTAEAFKPTEELLSKSVDIQTQMLQVMKDIFGIMSTKTEEKEDKTQSKKPGTIPEAYKAPPLPISMKRSA